MKDTRQKRILEIITEKEIGTQEELLQELRREGFDVTQATVSRDIRMMKLTKVAGAGGKSRYIAYNRTEEELTDKFKRIFCEGFLSMDNAQNILVIKTVPGMAMAVAAALDSMKFPEVVGCIAGDDTIMCAIRSNRDTAEVMHRLRKVIKDAKELTC
ncbi:MAG: arginine repressor [Lachnospiraceae bacterium]|nr:arginine repressor [Lachnospiraceae bacterium]